MMLPNARSPPPRSLQTNGSPSSGFRSSPLLHEKPKLAWSSNLNLSPTSIPLRRELAEPGSGGSPRFSSPSSGSMLQLSPFTGPPPPLPPMSRDLYDRLEKLETQKSAQLQLELQKLEARKTEQFKNELRQCNAEWESKMEVIKSVETNGIRHSSEVIDDRAKLQERIARLSTENDRLGRDLAHLKKANSEKEEAIRELRKAVVSQSTGDGQRQLQEENDALRREASDREESMRKINSQLNDIKIKRDNLKSVLDQQSIASGEHKTIAEENQRLQMDMVHLRNALSQKDASIKSLRKEVAATKKELLDIRKKRDDLSLVLERRQSVASSQQPVELNLVGSMRSSRSSILSKGSNSNSGPRFSSDKRKQTEPSSGRIASSRSSYSYGSGSSARSRASSAGSAEGGEYWQPAGSESSSTTTYSSSVSDGTAQALTQTAVIDCEEDEAVVQNEFFADVTQD